MRIESNGNTPWDKIRKFLANPIVEVILAIIVVVFAAWIVIETEAMHRRDASAFPVLFGFK